MLLLGKVGSKASTAVRISTPVVGVVYFVHYVTAGCTFVGWRLAPLMTASDSSTGPSALPWHHPAKFDLVLGLQFDHA
jgi:hypothetical protein